VQLEGCTKLGRQYICTGIDYLLKNFNDYCVTALFLSESDHAKRLCSTNVVPAQIVVEQLSRLIFLVYHPEKQLVTIVCPGKPEKRMIFRGARTITLEDECFAHSTAYKLTPHMQFSISTEAIKMDTSLKLRDLLGNLTTRTLDVIVPRPPRSDIKIPDLIKQYWEIQEKLKGKPIRLEDLLGISISTSTLYLGLACLLVFIFRHRLGHMFHRAVHARPDEPPFPPTPELYRNIRTLNNARPLHYNSPHFNALEQSTMSKRHDLLVAQDLEMEEKIAELLKKCKAAKGELVEEDENLLDDKGKTITV
jgi:hypothetical protein